MWHNMHFTDFYLCVWYTLSLNCDTIYLCNTVPRSTNLTSFITVSNHRRFDGLLNRWFRRRSKKTKKLRVIGLCKRNLPVTGEFQPLKASNAVDVSIWWRHHNLRWKLINSNTFTYNRRSFFLSFLYVLIRQLHIIVLLEIMHRIQVLAYIYGFAYKKYSFPFSP